MKAIIPTGGRGTRMRPLTFSANKHFIPVANQPLIFYPIETVAKAGIKEIGITYNPGGLEEAQAVLGDGSKWGVKFTFILQEKPAGLANIVQVAEDFIGDDRFVFHLGDNIFVEGIEDLVNRFEKSPADALVTMIHHKDNHRLGVPFFDDLGQFIKYVEKPDNPPNDYGIPGLYFFSSKVFEAFKGQDAIAPSARGELEIGSLYNWLIDHGFKVDAEEYQGKWLDPGKFDDWLESNRFLLDTRVIEKLDSEIDENSAIEGRVEIGPDCQISGTHIRGPVSIGKNVKLENSYIGPFTSINDDCQIFGSHIENSVLMPKVKVSEVKQPITSSIIGTEAEIVHAPTITEEIHLFIGEKSKVEI